MRGSSTPRSVWRHPWIVGAFLVFGGLLVSGCGAAQRTAAAEQTDVQLSRFAEPAFVALSKDGAVWVTDSLSNSITRVDAVGELKEYPLPENGLEFPDDIVEGPDGAMWFVASSTVGRIDSRGRISSAQAGGWPGAIAAGVGGLWYTNQDDPLRVERISAAGLVTAIVKLVTRNEGFSMPGIASGPDGALWFTQSSYDGSDDLPDAIGRVTTDDHYSSWRLPNRRSTPARITAGPDKALWFTEQLGHRIGRITTTGAITEFPLPEGLSPFDITDGKDGALWFTTDTCIGRITTGGDVTTWPVANAKELVGIAAAPDGSFWVADRLGHALRHFTPPQPATAPATACHPPSVAARSGSTRAVLLYKRVDSDKSYGDFFTDARIHISRKGKEIFSEVLPAHPDGYSDYRVFGYTPSFTVRDLDGDGEPEVKLELDWGGTHCCEWSRTYRFSSSRETYIPVTHFWGDASSRPSLRDLDDDGRPEFVSHDDRFTELTFYAGVMEPIQLWSYGDGKFSDVTRSYPKLIQEDAAALWHFYLRDRGKRTVRPVLAAWAADEYMLGRATNVDQTLTQALEAGYLAPKPGDSGDADGYIRLLRRFLLRTGYIRS